MSTLVIVKNTDNRIDIIGWSEPKFLVPSDHTLVTIPASVEANPQFGALLAHTNGVATSYTAPTLPTYFPTADEITVYGRQAVDFMNPSWITTANGTKVVGTTTESRVRWRNTRMWIGSLVECTKALIAADAPTFAQKEYGWRSLQALLPLDKESIGYWYRNHDRTQWATYSDGLSTGNKDAHAAYLYTGDKLPAFGDDLNSATLWDGVTAGTLDIGVPQNWNG